MKAMQVNCGRAEETGEVNTEASKFWFTLLIHVAHGHGRNFCVYTKKEVITVFVNVAVL